MIYTEENLRLVIYKTDELSLFHEHIFRKDGHEYNCLEQYICHQKAMYFNDKVAAQKVMDAKDPKIQRDAGKSARGFSFERWNRVVEWVLFDGIRKKFENPYLKRVLLDTGNKYIAHFNSGDDVWAYKLNDLIGDEKTEKSEKNIKVVNTKVWDSNNWIGQNLLGKVLMDVRKFIKDEEDNYNFIKQQGMEVFIDLK